MSIYDFKVKTNNGEEVCLDKYRGKVLLIVNTASKCGFTSQYAGLEELYKEYNARGFEVLGFPSNQFAGQEPGNDEEIKQFCTINYGVTFPLFAKGDVRGETAQPLFKYLTEQTSFQGFDPAHPVTAKLEEVLQANFPEFLEGASIKWNFTKFLIDRSWNIVGRFEPTTEATAIKETVEKYLGQ
ncbi:MAG: glutathione peroxidase [Candidatus Eremiobacterota bacterium]